MTKGGSVLELLKEDLLERLDDEVDDVSRILNCIDELLHKKKHPNNK